MTLSTSTILVGALLGLIQLLAAVPWLVVALLGPDGWRAWRRNPFSQAWLTRYAIALACAIGLPILFFSTIQGPETLRTWGQIYLVVLQVQLLTDLFVVVFAVLLKVWPKGGAVALAAFREGVRQPMYWLLTGLGLLLLFAWVFIPYFTLGDDALMIRDIGNDTIMFFAVLFGTLAASMSVSDEIEGKTAVTMMSKPVSRRQFLLGKFGGILLAGLLMYVVLGTWFQGMLLLHRWWTIRFDMPEPRQAPTWVSDVLAQWQLPGEANDFLYGIGLWWGHAIDTLPGLVLSFMVVMILVAIAVSLATRVPMAVNLTTILMIYFLANLNPILLALGKSAQASDPGSTVSQLLGFVAQVFDTVLPDLHKFRIDPALLGDAPPAPWAFAQYIGSIALLGFMFTAIALLFGLILFEDRDLA